MKEVLGVTARIEHVDNAGEGSITPSSEFVLPRQRLRIAASCETDLLEILAVDAKRERLNREIAVHQVSTEVHPNWIGISRLLNFARKNS